MRIIDADALLERWCSEVCKAKPRCDEDCMFYDYLTIDSLSPTIEPEPQWIPCSEKLPEYRKLVDVTTRGLRVKLAYLDSIEEDGTDDLWIIPLEDAECALWNVVAWKPRPEPWKGDK